MNKVILIGNGFDLAHGLKTSYNDFILWYLNKSANKFKSQEWFKDELMTISWRQNRFLIKEFTSIKDFNEARKNIDFKFKNIFFDDIISQTHQYGWVDIEAKYYGALVNLYKSLVAREMDNLMQVTKSLNELNECFNYLKKELTEYLSTIDNKQNKRIEDINLLFSEELRQAQLQQGNYDHKERNKILILNFNYTSTVETYIDRDTANFFTINYIHGKLNDENNPLIFGYGDEMHKDYEKIEQLDIDEFLRNIKSFGYFRTKNYQDFETFIRQAPFYVYILGHSCGLSDRILLNSIFEHSNCKKIKIFYHQKSKNKSDNDFLEKTQKISRHFKAENKEKMRIKIVPYPDSVPLINQI